MKVVVFDKHCDKHNDIHVSIMKHVKENGFEIDEANPDVVFYIGGDGTFLDSVHTYFHRLDKTIFIGICVSGSLGFFYDGQIQDIPEMFRALKTKEYKVDELNLLSADIYSGDSYETIYAVNEIRIENPFHTLISKVEINGNHLENFRGNGLVISSAIGSSAYNRSLGGALIDPSLKLIELTEIASIQHNEYRSLGSSLVLDGKSVISLSGDFTNVVVGYDSLTHSNKQFNKINLTLSDKKVKLLRSRNYSYIKKLEKSFIK